MTPDRLDTILADLRARGEPFALATVVRTVDATSPSPAPKPSSCPTAPSPQAGSAAAAPAAPWAAPGPRAIKQGKPQFVSLRPEELLAAEGVAPGDERQGVRFARNGCPSKGSMDVFVEPVLPRPQLVILAKARSPMRWPTLPGAFDLHRIHAAPG